MMRRRKNGVAESRSVERMANRWENWTPKEHVFGGNQGTNKTVFTRNA
jgi:AAA+ superfamily predicted ATPase